MIIIFQTICNDLKKKTLQVKLTSLQKPAIASIYLLQADERRRMQFSSRVSSLDCPDNCATNQDNFDNKVEAPGHW